MRVCYNKPSQEAGGQHALQLHAEPSVGAPAKRGIRDPGNGNRCRHGPQDRTPVRNECATTRTPNMRDVVMGQFQDRVSPTADAMQHGSLRGGAPGRELDGVGGAKQRLRQVLDGEADCKICCTPKKCRHASSAV